MKPIEVGALVIGRLLAVLCMLLLLLALTWPWAMLRVGNPALQQELPFSFSGADITALASADAALAPKLIAAIDDISRFDRSARRDLDPIRDQLAQMQRASSLIFAWVAAIWVSPLVALVLALVLLITNGGLRFRRGFGAAIGVMALISLVALLLTKMRIDGVMAQFRAIPALSDMFDSLDRSGIDVSLRVENGITSALIFAALGIVGGLIESILPLHLTAPAHGSTLAMQPISAPVLQAAGAPVEIAAFTPSPIVEPAGERIQCVQCGRSLPARARFCGGCGAQQESVTQS